MTQRTWIAWFQNAAMLKGPLSAVSGNTSSQVD